MAAGNFNYWKLAQTNYTVKTGGYTMQRNFETSFVTQCAPVLAGLKVAVNYESMFRGLVRKYNKTQKVALPKVMTPHTLRHTFCTTLANAGMNPKALQYIMGHSNINMTLNYYAHTTSETSITEMKRLIA